MLQELFLKTSFCMRACYIILGISPCAAAPCQNGGTCTQSGTCDCLDGWSGDSCQTSKNLQIMRIRSFPSNKNNMGLYNEGSRISCAIFREFHEIERSMVRMGTSQSMGHKIKNCRKYIFHFLSLLTYFIDLRVHVEYVCFRYRRLCPEPL